MLGRKRIVYLAGPMTGYPDKNYPKFNAVAKELREMGHTVYNPAERPFDNARNAFHDYSVFITQHACTIVLLPGHKKSVGATAERALAVAVGLDIYNWMDVR